jgi:hypothetical protein
MEFREEMSAETEMQQEHKETMLRSRYIQGKGE